GGKVQVGKHGHNRCGTSVHLGEDSVEIRCFEETECIDDKSAPSRSRWNREYKPNGKLVLTVENGGEGVRARWADSQRKPLERMLDSVIAGMHEHLEQHRLRRLDAECRSRQNALVKVRRDAKTKKKELEETYRTGLVEATNKWHQAQRI